jgi:hypothetical protein
MTYGSQSQVIWNILVRRYRTEGRRQQGQGIQTELVHQSVAIGVYRTCADAYEPTDLFATVPERNQFFTFLPVLLTASAYPFPALNGV